MEARGCWYFFYFFEQKTLPRETIVNSFVYIISLFQNYMCATAMKLQNLNSTEISVCDELKIYPDINMLVLRLRGSWFAPFVPHPHPS